MFERFTAESRRAVHLAVSEARVLGASRIGPDHLLIGVSHGRSGPAAEALAAAGLDPRKLRAMAVREPVADPLDADSLAAIGVDLDAVRRAAEAAFGLGALDRPARPTGRRTTRARMTPDAKKALECALRTAQQRHDNALTAGHILIGIIDQGNNQALRLLAAADVDPAVLRSDTLRRMAAA